jgi:CheY-like chemotaxis protein
MSSTCNVVVADDNRDAADTLVELLGAMGYSAVAVYDGRAAVEACAALQPELAILDVCDAARLIRSGARPPAIIAALSCLRHWEEPLKSGLGLFDFRLAKPPRMDQLVKLVHRAIGAGAAPDSARSTRQRGSR